MFTQLSIYCSAFGSMSHNLTDVASLTAVFAVMAAQSIANIVKSSLGPVGLDKMLVDDIGDVTITNDGATILQLLEVEHPAAKVIGLDRHHRVFQALSHFKRWLFKWCCNEYEVTRYDSCYICH